MQAERQDTDVCILGAGPHGLAAAVHLLAADPDLDIAVLDPSGGWLTTWVEQFRRAEIETLRSPVVHHPSPDPFALLRYINDHQLPRSGLPYDLPTADAFAQFCRALIDHVGLAPPIAASPRDIRSDGQSVLVDAGRRSITARHLVLATNPHQRPIPDWVWPMLGHQPELVAHGLDIDLSTLPDLTDQRVSIIGGGLTAAHLAHGAASRGASVDLISRCKLRVRSFDTAPGWLGPKYLRSFDAEPDPARRLAIAAQARTGGSIPAWMHDRLTAFGETGRIELRESTVVRSGEPIPSGGCTLHLSTGPIHAHRVWLATGTWADAHALKCARPLLQDVAALQGLPIVDQTLRLGPHPAYVMGRLATLSLGPAAGNLWGAQRAAQRITKVITGVDLEGETIARMPAPART